MISPVIFWNLRGVGTSQLRLRKLIKRYKPNILALAEPVLPEDRILDFFFQSLVVVSSLLMKRIEVNFGYCRIQLF